MTQYIKTSGIQVATSLYQFIEHEVLPQLKINSEQYWQNFSNLIEQYTPQNQALLNQRDKLQMQIDQYYRERQPYRSDETNQKEYQQFLKSINYLEPEVSDFSISTSQVDDEIAVMAGPQLVVPVMNARFALNAVNARWGSLYDALYSSDIINQENGKEIMSQYNPQRGKEVINIAKNYLTQYAPLTSGDYHDVTSFSISNQQLRIGLNDNTQTTLLNEQQFVGYTGDMATPDSILLKHHGLLIEIQLDSQHPIAQSDPSGISDVLLESALTTIMDCEDSIAAVDAEDKVIAYRNWLQLNQGTLTEQVTKQGRTFERKMAPDKLFFSPSGEQKTTKGRSLMFIRNVGHLMTNPAILDQQNQPVFEGIMDAMITTTIGLFDIHQQQQLSNSECGSIYIVKPKMHGSAEVKFANDVFSTIESMLNIPQNTVKMGIMDEERRTSVNLKSCIYQAKERVVFINTGFLDRTGDEIHTCMVAGPVERKADIKNTPWITNYELNNVAVGLACGFSGKAQIGKGMWPIPDQMNAMLTSKQAHPLSGANTAWVPSPTAATLHALHYHDIDVFKQQKQLLSQPKQNYLNAMLTPPLAQNPDWTIEQIEQELDNNAQGLLGYVVRWIDQGVGCSKVPDINDVGLMEDRATLRISSQHITNWLKHNICTKEQVMASLIKMAKRVDSQNQQDPHYQPMSTDLENNIAFQAAKALIFEGEIQPNGYTEPLLHKFRALKKQKNNELS